MRTTQTEHTTATVPATPLRAIFPLAALLCLLLWQTRAAAQPGIDGIDGIDGIEDSPPNILVILADDAGYADFGFQGGGIDGDFAELTPRIDALAAHGARFTNGYVTGPICSPSRAGLLTGRYQHRFGFEDNVRNFENAGLAPFQKTIADRLRSLGYRTYAVGKWHLGADLDVFHPNQRGFDEFFGFLAGGRTYYHCQGAVGPVGNCDIEKRLQHNGELLTEDEDQYLTTIFGDAAADFIDSHADKTPDQPFFMYLAFNAVHTPMEPDPADENNPDLEHIDDVNRKKLASMTLSMDKAVGTVLDKLAEKKLRDNTLVVFLSDNGGPVDGNLESYNWADNGPLREGKGTMYEGGIRVPFVVAWPDRIDKGIVIDDPVIALDLLPTFVAAAGGELFPDIATDGANLLPRLTDKATRPIERCLFWRIEGAVKGQRAVRQGNWKLYRRGTEAAELYDLASDIGETNNLADTYREKVEELLEAHATWERGIIEPLWGRGPIRTSTPDLVVRASPLGYKLEKSGSDYGYAAYGLREPLSLDEDWILEWSMESLEAANRNGYVVLGHGTTEDGDVASVIRIGVDFDTQTMSITEVQAGDTSETSFGEVPPEVLDATLSFRLEYEAATGFLRLRYRDRSLSHTLSETSHELTHAGFALWAEAAANFSAINHHLIPLSPPSSPSWTDLDMTTDYTPGSEDENGRLTGGTEALSLVTHKGRLFAGIGYWNDVRFGPMGSPDPHPGAQVLVKDAAGEPWREDVAFGPEYLRVESLQSITVTTDKTGAALDPPVTLLLAGTSAPVINEVPLYTEIYVFIRDDFTGEWRRTSPGNANFPVARFIFDHVDRVTGVHHIFCAYGGQAKVVRGAYDAASGLIEWDSKPELTGTKRMVSGGECNGWLYACIGTDGDPYNDNGGVFWREDGDDPKWHLVHEFEDTPDFHEDVRGFTAVPHPKGLGYDVALVGLNSLSTIVRIDPIGGDPRNGHVLTEELNIQQFLGDLWTDGSPLDDDNIIAAYNDMPELTDPATGDPVHFIGLWLKHHPDGPDSDAGKSSWYLIRRLDATYDWGQVFDPESSRDIPLRGCRAARPSPFPEEAGRVVYLSGFDAATPYWHNTAWIYRAELPTRALPFERGDANADGTTDIADPVYILNYLFGGGPTPSCEQTADANDDNNVDIADPVYEFNYLFGGGPPMDPPVGECGTDPTPAFKAEDNLSCESYPPCAA